MNTFSAHPSTSRLRSWTAAPTDVPCRSWRVSFLALFVFGLSATLEAQTIFTSGLTLEDAPTLGAGNSEFSAAYSDRVPDGSYGIILAPGDDYSRRWQCLAFGAVVGLRDGIDLVSEFRYCSNSRRGTDAARVEGIGDLRFGLKLGVWEPGAGTSLAWVNSLSLPVRPAHADDELSATSRTMGTDQILVLSHMAARIGASLQGGLHYGYDAGEGAELLLHVAVGAGYQLGERLQPRIELHAEQPLRGTDAAAISATAGVLYALGERLRLDIGLQVAAHGESAWRDRTFVARLVVTP